MQAIATKLSRLALNDEGFAFDPATGDAFRLNRTAVKLVRGVQAGRGEMELAQQISDEFDTPHDRALRDVGDFFIRLKSLSLL